MMCIDFQVLSLHPWLGRTVCQRPFDRGLPGNAFSESVFIQSGKTPSSSDRQHDVREAYFLLVPLDKEDSLDGMSPFGSFSQYVDVSWATNALCYSLPYGWTFDTSDLQGGRTGRKQSYIPEKYRAQRTNFTCYPRVSAGFAVSQGISYLLAAGATGCGGSIARHLGAEGATAAVAAVLVGLTILLTLALMRVKTIRLIPDRISPVKDEYGRRQTEWQPVIIGNPSGTTRRVSILELGSLSRWTEIRQRNRLIQGLDQMDWHGSQ
ncbi:MAG: hypothetical protein Q9227_000527 [Pyrenula ochraceoflavens]